MTGRRLLERADAAFARLEIARELEHLASGLERLTERTGDARFRHAARILRGRVGGRPAINDAAALAEVERLAADGKPLSVALGFVARRLSAANPDSVARRLRRKLERKVGQNRFHPDAYVVRSRHERSKS